MNKNPPATTDNDLSSDLAIDFASMNRSYNSVFRINRLSVGLVVPIESYPGSAVPVMNQHVERVQLAEDLGFSAVWLRDVPFNVPSFGDAGQLFDPFVYLGLLAGQTQRIALGVASIILPLRHPAHVAKAAASVDTLSQGRLLLGVASGDRPEEYPAMDIRFDNRGESFSESFEYIRRMADNSPSFTNRFGQLAGQLDMLPKPDAGQLPMLVTGGAQQDPDWIAQHADGWMTYPREISAQRLVVDDLRSRLKATGRVSTVPVMQPLYVDLLSDPKAPPEPIHLGFRSGVNAFRDYMKLLESIGINHIALNLRFNQAGVDVTLRRLADELLPEFT